MPMAFGDTLLFVHNEGGSTTTIEAILETTILEQYVGYMFKENGAPILSSKYNCDQNISPFYR